MFVRINGETLLFYDALPCRPPQYSELLGASTRHSVCESASAGCDVSNVDRLHCSSRRVSWKSGFGRRVRCRSGMRLAISDLGSCSAVRRRRQHTHMAGAFPIRLQSQFPRLNLRCFQFLRNVVSRSEVHFVCGHHVSDGQTFVTSKLLGRALWTTRLVIKPAFLFAEPCVVARA